MYIIFEKKYDSVKIVKKIKIFKIIFFGKY